MEELQERIQELEAENRALKEDNQALKNNNLATKDLLQEKRILHGEWSLMLRSILIASKPLQLSPIGRLSWTSSPPWRAVRQRCTRWERLRAAAAK
jgi:hypothetical protein